MERKMPDTRHPFALNETCLRACRECVTTCESALGQLESPPPAWKPAADLCRSTIRICNVAIEELALNSTLVAQTCALAAVISRACADECERQAGGPWKEVAAACQQATKACHAVALPAKG